MLFPVALQLYSVREDLEKDFTGTLKAVKEFGYDGVEFAGLYDNTPEDIRKILEQIGLIPVSAHVSFDSLMADPQKVVGDYAAIGCKYIAIPFLSPEYRPGNEKFNDVIKGAKIIGKAAKNNGLTLLYHNHDFEFVKIDGEYALDILYQSVPADLLQTQIDTCWVKVAGENPSDYLRKYSGRAPVVHLKDFYMEGEDRKTADVFEFRPLGHGAQNIPDILKVCQDIGTGWVVVEQDRPSMNKTAMECAKMSIDYLKSLK